MDQTVTHYILMPARRSPTSTRWPVYGTITPQGVFQAVTGQQFNGNLAHTMTQPQVYETLTHGYRMSQGLGPVF